MPILFIVFRTVQTTPQGEQTQLTILFPILCSLLAILISIVRFLSISKLKQIETELKDTKKEIDYLKSKLKGVEKDIETNSKLDEVQMKSFQKEMDLRFEQVFNLIDARIAESSRELTSVVISYTKETEKLFTQSINKIKKNNE